MACILDSNPSFLCWRSPNYTEVCLTDVPTACIVRASQIYHGHDLNGESGNLTPAMLVQYCVGSAKRLCMGPSPVSRSHVSRLRPLSVDARSSSRAPSNTSVLFLLPHTLEHVGYSCSAAQVQRESPVLNSVQGCGSGMLTVL